MEKRVYVQALQAALGYRRCPVEALPDTAYILELLGELVHTHAFKKA